EVLASRQITTAIARNHRSNFGPVLREFFRVCNPVQPNHISRHLNSSNIDQARPILAHLESKRKSLSIGIASSLLEQTKSIASPGRLASQPRFAPTIFGKEPVGVGSAPCTPGGSVAFAVASGKRAFISRRKPSSVSTLAAILAIAPNSALEVAAGLLAVSNAARSASPLISGAYFSRNRASPIASSASA